MKHYRDKLESETRAMIAASCAGDQLAAQAHNKNCEDYQAMIDMDMKKVWERNRVN